MVKNTTSQGKVIDFDAARKSTEAPIEVKAAVNKPARGGGFLDTWLKNHENSQSLVNENLFLKEQKYILEEERNSLIPSFSENILYYTIIILGVIYLIGWVTTAVIKGVYL